jgi:hypothetical protein
MPVGWPGYPNSGPLHSWPKRRSDAVSALTRCLPESRRCGFGELQPSQAVPASAVHVCFGSNAGIRREH